MALKFSDIDGVISRANPSSDVDKVALAKLQAARDFAKSQKINSDEIKATLFAGFLMDDYDSWNLMFRLLPRDYINDLLEFRLGGKFTWHPDQVAKLLGVKDPINLVKPPKGYSMPQWKVGRGETPEEIIQSYADQYPELDARKLYEWLKAYQDQYDIQNKYTGGGLNALRGVFAPRVQESLLRTGDYKPKDVAGDVAENALLAIPTERLLANSLFMGLKSGMLPFPAKLASKMGGKTHTAFNVGQNFVVPTAIEEMDYGLYGDEPGNTRGKISPVNIATLGGVNLGVNAGLGSYARRSARRLGTEAPTGVFNTNPYTQMVHEYAEGGVRAGVRSPQARKSAEILADIDKAKSNKKTVEALKEQKLKDMEEWLAAGGDPLDPEAIERYRQKYNEIILSDMTPSERKEALKLLEEENPSRLYESDYLPEDVQKAYGISEDGYVGKVTSDFSPLNSGSEYGLELFVPEERSFYNLKKAEKGKHRNKSINRESEGDKALTNLRNKPEVGLLLGSKTLGKPIDKIVPYVKEMPESYLKNKLGKEQFAEPTIKKVGEVVEQITSDYPPEVKAVLDDPLTIRIWENTSIRPNFAPGDPLWEAYKIKYPEKAKEIEEQAKKAGKKAGF